MNRRTVHLLVRGRVQGVGFRWFVRERASALGITGWVRNRPDGSVEVQASGDDRSTATFLAQLRAGPPRSDVLELQIRDVEPAPGDIATFDIRH